MRSFIMTNEINGLPRPRPAGPDEAKGTKTPATGVGARTSPASTPGGTAVAPSDTIKLTEAAARLQRLEASMSEMPVVDQRRVEALKREIDSGAYRVDPDGVAEKLVALERALGRSR
jgi:negative regulator of flagellin synthesis FlgM